MLEEFSGKQLNILNHVRKMYSKTVSSARKGRLISAVMDLHYKSNFVTGMQEYKGWEEPLLLESRFFCILCVTLEKKQFVEDYLHE